MSDIEKTRKHLFQEKDEITFKQQFAIHWLASIESVNYEKNCNSRWSMHHPPVEDAHRLAEIAWDEWKETIGFVD